MIKLYGNVQDTENIVHFKFDSIQASGRAQNLCQTNKTPFNEVSFENVQSFKHYFKTYSSPKLVGEVSAHALRGS